MKKLAILILPLSLCAFATSASANDDAKQRPWVLKMKEKFPDHHAGWEKTYDAVQAAKAAWRAFLDGEWKSADNKAKRTLEMRQKHHDLQVAVWKAENEHAQWGMGWRNMHIERVDKALADFKAKLEAKANKGGAPAPTK